MARTNSTFYDLKELPRIRAEGIAISEDCEQAWLFQWAKRTRDTHPELDMLYAVPNGGWRGHTQGSHLKLTGVKSGVPDTTLPVPRGNYHGMYIEMKRFDGGVVSKEQREWIDRLTKYGYLAVVCYGFEEAQRTIIEYLDMGRG